MRLEVTVWVRWSVIVQSRTGGRVWHLCLILSLSSLPVSVRAWSTWWADIPLEVVFYWERGSFTHTLTHSLSPSLSLTVSHTHTHTHTHSLSLSHTYTLTLTHSLSLSHTHTHTHTVSHTHTHTHTHSHAHSHTHTHTHTHHTHTSLVCLLPYLMSPLLPLLFPPPLKNLS